MARHKFNLDTQEQHNNSMLIYGVNAVGKTFLLCDFLKEESKHGPVRFINIVGEDGAGTGKGLGLGDIGEDIDLLASFEEALAEYTKAGVVAIAVDGFHFLNAQVRTKQFGSDRYPNSPDEWGALHMAMENLTRRYKRSAKWTMVSCPADRSGDAVLATVTGDTKKAYVTPDLPGKEARISAGWFDFVGYMDLSPTGPGKLKRTIQFNPDGRVTVRQRLPYDKQIKEPVVLPEGPGGWKLIKDKIEGAWK